MNSLRSFGNFEKPGLESFGFLIFATNKHFNGCHFGEAVWATEKSLLSFFLLERVFT